MPVHLSLKIIAALFLMVSPAAANILILPTTSAPPPANCAFKITGGVTHFTAGTTFFKC